MFDVNADVVAALTALAFDLGITVVLQYLEYVRQSILKQVETVKCFDNVSVLRKELEASSNKIIKYGCVIGSALKIVFGTTKHQAEHADGMTPFSLEFSDSNEKVKLLKPHLARFMWNKQDQTDDFTFFPNPVGYFLYNLYTNQEKNNTDRIISTCYRTDTIT